jgi:transcriptional regulator with XRE-family HTH domain
MDPLILDNVIKLKADGYKSIYYVKTKGLELIFRPLTFDEYETLMGLESYIDEAAINDCILDIAVLFCTKGSNWIKSYSRAFEIDHIAQKILDVSGFRNKQTFYRLLKEKRALAKEVQSLIEIYICTAFKAISPLELKNMSLEEQVELLAKAEEALGKPIDFHKILEGDDDPRERAYPTPKGMESSKEFLDESVADKVDWNKLNG